MTFGALLRLDISIKLYLFLKFFSNRIVSHKSKQNMYHIIIFFLKVSKNNNTINQYIIQFNASIILFAQFQIRIILLFFMMLAGKQPPCRRKLVSLPFSMFIIKQINAFLTSTNFQRQCKLLQELNSYLVCLIVSIICLCL